MVILTIMLPALLGTIGLVLDGGMLMLEARHCQQVADAAATSAASELRLGRSLTVAKSAASDVVVTRNEMTDATILCNSPPTSGKYSGSSKHVEVRIERQVPTYLVSLFTGARYQKASARSVAGYEDSTAGAAIVVLDPSPESFSISPLTLPVVLPSLPSLLGGLEILGVGKVSVDGSVLINTQWGGMDENGDPAGIGSGPPYALATTPFLPLTQLRARDVRVVGGVSQFKTIGNLQAGKPSPLHANRIAVPDPFADLPVPTLSADPVNVSSTNYGGKTVIGLPLIGTKLYPGVYDWIDIVAGKVQFMPGIYIIRGRHPVTRQSLNILAGQVTAEGVMFYLTDTQDYLPASGLPDSGDGETEPAAPSVGTLVPSAIMNIGLLASSFTPLNSPGSPFDGMMIYQRRQDRRPIVIVQENIIGGGTLNGTIYAKWGHILLAGKGNYDARFVAGTMRIVALLDCSISPTTLLPSAKDVFLFE